ncbi:MAG: hypothetical protein HY738_11130 [Bacteroidia bacterium]|nr:hypothetical protein [Bacteroidia bacterium]
MRNIRILYAVIVLVIFISCNNKNSTTQENPKKIVIHFSNSLTLSPDVIKHINNFVREGNAKDTNRMYQLYIGNSFPYGSKYLFLTEIKYKAELNDLPIGFINIENNPILIYSDISKFCKNDITIIQNAGILNRIKLIEDTLSGDYKEWLQQKRNWYIEEDNNIFESGKAKDLPPPPSKDTSVNFSAPEVIKQN